MRIRHIKQRSGFVIVVVLSIITMLAVILLCFNRQSKNDLRAAESLKKTYQAYNCARSALNIVIAAIGNNADIEGKKSSIDLFSGKKTFDIDSYQCSAEITDENGKINLNKLIDEQGKPCKAAIEQFLCLIDVLNRQSGSRINYGIVPAIVDWIDADDNVISLPFLRNDNMGAESAYYMKLNPSYKCRNAPLDAIDELLPVKGITPETYARIRKYVTAYGEGKVNINSAPKEVVESLSGKMDASLAQAIIDRRNFKFFETIAELRQFPWMTDAVYNEIKDKLTIRPAEKYYTITAKAENPDGCTIIATVKLNSQTKKIDVVWYTELSGEQDK
jgi:general secretion pathway protein K